MNPTSSHPENLDTLTSDGERMLVSLSTDPVDSEWDDFLEESSQGHFQQSSGWGRYKMGEGWSVLRVTYAASGKVRGGFQMLWKSTRKGRIAYVSKGPVPGDSSESASREVVHRIKQLAASHGFRAVIVQPPDECSSTLQHALADAGLIPCSFLGIIDSTMLIDLSVGAAKVVSRFRGSTRNKRNKATRAGMIVRDGSDDDLSEFFHLMLMTCERQKEEPNPPSEASLRALWSSLNAERKRVHLKLTCFNDETVSGDLLIMFGGRVTIFKTGWNGQHRDLNPNNFRICQTLEWAASQNYLLADFVAFGRDLATTMIAGKKLNQNQNKHRDAFKAGFGGFPKLLPCPGLWIPNALLRFSFQQAAKLPFFRRKLKQLVR